MSELISPCCNEELILVAAIDTKRLYKCSKCKNYTKPKKMKNYTKPKKMKKAKEINIVWWSKDDWYFIPTFNLHVEYRCFSFYFLKFTLELAY